MANSVDFRVKNGLLVASTATIQSSANATSTASGALQIVGGVGIGRDLYVGGTIYGNGIITTATNLAGGVLGQIPYQAEAGTTQFIGTGTVGSLLQMGANTATFVTTGSVYVGYANIASASSLVAITNDLTATAPNYLVAVSTSSGNQSLEVTAAWGPFVIPNTGVVIVNTVSNATSTGTGALVVKGGVGVGASLFIGGTATVVSGLASTTTLSANALYIAGGVGIAKSLLVTGEAIFQNNVTFSGTTTYVLSTNTIVTDNIINIHTPSGGVSGAWTVDDGKDIGLVFHNYKGVDNDSFLGWANDSGYLEWYGAGQETVGGTFTNAVYGIFKTGGIILTNTTASNSVGTGALTVAGGVGIGGNLYVGGTVFGTISGSITTATSIAGGILGQIPYQTSAGVTQFIGTGTAGTILQMGANTATFVTTGSIYVGFANQAVYANTATNVAGGVLGQIPYQSATGTTQYIGTGTAGTILQMGANTATFVTTGTVYIANAVTATNVRGGANGSIPYQTAAGATQFINTGTTGSLLQMGATTATFVSSSSVYVGYANTATTATSAAVAYSLANSASLTIGSATTATNIAGGVAGQLHYQTAPGLTGFVTTAASGYVLVSGGSGSPVYQNTLALSGTNASGNTQSGALTVAGGVGIGGSIYTGQDIYIGPNQIRVGGGAFSGSSNLDNVVLGKNAFGSNTSGFSNIAIGTSALAANVSTNNNTAVGAFALTANLASFNTAVGSSSLNQNTSGSENTAVGSSSLGQTTTGGSNSAIGAFALNANKTGTGNSAVGRQALTANTSGSYNSALGSAALSSNIIGAFNVAIGAGALSSNTGSGNIAIGYNAGNALTNGSGNVIIGNVSGTAGLSDTIIIAAGSTERFRVDSSGNMILAASTNATSTASGALQIPGGVGIGRNLYVGGTIFGTVSGSITTATNIAGGTLGQIHYQTAAGVTGFIGTGTTGSLLQMGANTATFVTTGSIYVGYANLAANATTATSAAVAYSLANTATIYAANANVANQINTLVQTANATYFPAFVDSNNATVTAESVYTTSTFIINPSTGQVGINTSILTTSSKLVVNGRIESITDPAAEGGQVVLRGKNFYRWSIDNYQDTFRIIKEDDVTESNGVTAVTITSGTNAVMIGASTQYSGEKLGVNGGVYVNGILTATSIFGTFNGTIGSASVNTATNLAGGTNGAIVYQVSSGATSFIGVGSAGSLLQMGASTATFVTTGSIYVGFANQAVYANTATNMAGGTNGAIHYQVSPGVSSYIGTGTSGSLLQMGATTATFVTTGSIYVYRATQADSATGSSSQVNTVAQTANANYVLTFVDSNNATATGESVYTTSTVYVNPSSGQLVATSIVTTQNGNGQNIQIGDDLWIGDVNQNSTARLSGGPSGDPTKAYLIFGNSDTNSLGRSGTGPLTYTAAFQVNGTFTATNTTNATSTSSAALTVAGGVGIGRDLYVGGTIFGTISGSITTATNIAGGVLGQIHYQTASGATGFIGTGTVGSILQMSANTATFVTSGSIYVGFANQAANATTATSAAVAYSLASTSSLYASFANQALYANTATNIAGGVLGQIPYQSAIGTTQYIGTGTTGSLLQMGANTATFVTTGTVYIANAVTSTNIRGGSNGSIPYQTAAGATQFINIGSAGTVLQSNGTTASFVAVGTLSAGTATNMAGGLLGQILYQTGAGTTGFIGTGTNGSILQMGANTATFVTTSSIYVGRAVIADNASTASQVTTVAQTANATYFLTFVDANNATPLVETIYTTSSFTVNAASGGVRIGGVTTVTNTTNASSTITGALQVVGGMGVGRDLWVGAGVYAATKSFLIDHPSKPGWKLVHGSLEGPENGVYVRGKITGSNKIHLPDFWINLVDFDAITVNLTPIGKYQQLFVENVQGLEITIANAQGSDMNFFYTVWAERIDVDKLRVEVN